MADEGSSGFLPPEPTGPEPDLGGSGSHPTQPLPAPQQTQPHPQLHPQPQPQPHQAWGYHPPPPQYGYGYGQGPPPGYGPAQPPGYGWQPQPAWAPPPAEPANNKAVAGFAISVTTAFLWLTFLGFPVLGVGLSVAGLIFSRQGKRDVAEGRTRSNAGLAQAGWIISIIMIVLTVLSTLGWIIFVIAVATDDSFRHDLGNPHRSTAAIAVLRGLIGLL